MRKRCLYHSSEELLPFGEEGRDDVTWDWDYSALYNSRIVGQQLPTGRHNVYTGLIQPEQIKSTWPSCNSILGGCRTSESTELQIFSNLQSIMIWLSNQMCCDIMSVL